LGIVSKRHTPQSRLHFVVFDDAGFAVGQLVIGRWRLFPLEIGTPVS
jgi:hypothetical protein